MGKVEAAEQDLTAAGGGGVADQNPSGFDPIVDKDMWLDMNEASIFYDDFPTLPDFPCMSSSSSSSSTQPALKPIAVTSSSSSATSAASWAVMRSDAEEDSSGRMSFQQFQDEVKMDDAAAVAALSSTASDADVMESLGYMDLIDCNELWDPSSVFQSENPQEFMEEQPAPPPVAEKKEEDGLSFLQGNAEMVMIFFEWLKQNKDHISAEDMRSIKLKRSTIESASKRLGTTKEGKKQLLKLILDWVEQHQLQKKAKVAGAGASTAVAAPFPFQETAQFAEPINPNPNFVYNPDPNAPQWMQQPEVVAPPSFAQPMPMNHGVVNGIPFQHSAEYPMMEHAPSWAMPPPFQPPQQPQFSPFPDNGGSVVNGQQSLYGNPYQMYDPNGERVMRLGSSATKEARKKRMARQRKLYPHPHRHSSNSNQQRDGQLNDSRVDDGDHDGSLGDWGCWAPGEGGTSSPTAGQQPNSADQATAQQQNGQRPSATAASDRRPQQGWKTEKNLKFLLQKVLKQSDVGNLGRIVLPKKEAESHLPELETRDGISITMEDIGTSRVWNMRYRFWPNNKSRMYLLENTGDFVRANGLQEGDFIVIYSDTKCGKYMIRGVKVRQLGGKLEGKKPARRNVRSLSSLGGNSSSPLAPIRQAIR
ncbi:B3 domain-containing transcription factor [Salvia divinorum]|uniref:B3 domain-containing transcription factor n=1 Tax=Salvia divinorum TaxID=28513 RepID=A0ABD1GRK9_SALDI